jgi:hypothetical protein
MKNDMLPSMKNDLRSSLRELTDDELLGRLETLARRERAAVAELIAHLAELDTRDTHLRMGYGSLYVYCRDALALSEAEAFARIEVARAARRFPVVLDLLGSGALNLTTVRLLASRLTPENHLRVLESARGKRRAEIEVIVAGLAPRPDVRAVVRRLANGGTVPSLVPANPASGAPGSAPPAILATPGPPPAAIAQAQSAISPAIPAAPPTPDGRIPTALPTLLLPSGPAPATIQPLAAERYRLHVTIDGAVLEKLRLAKDMLRHAIPSGDDAAILDRALTALLADLAKRKFAATAAPRGTPGSRRGSRHIPAETRRTVWLRDLGRCAFVGELGRRCGERGFLEFHHVRPYAVGGEPPPDNVQLRCRRHSGLEARLYFDRSEVSPVFSR